MRRARLTLLAASCSALSASHILKTATTTPNQSALLSSPRPLSLLATASAPAALAPTPHAVAAEPPNHPAYELLRVEMVDEYTLKVATYRHKKSGAEVISAQADDDNKVFGIVFRTPVSDDTGVPHILEHSVLCGSDKYTSKEPFTELLKGSLQTFLNAFTYPDRTCYPVASQNTKDFYNLINVYLDAVLNPRAKRDPEVLKQEGWHYELDKADEPLTYKGVVFNEMKGVYSSPDSILYKLAQQATFPDTTYASDSGGDPVAIPNLTFEQFTAFHDAYYHPANSRVWFYGDDDVTARLDLLDSYLRDFDAPPTPPASEVATQPRRYTEPVRVVAPFPASDAEAAPDAASHMVMLSWLLNEEPLSQVDELALNILDQLLMGTRTAELYKPLMESGLGAAVIGGGLSDELKQATFSAGLKGVKKEDVSKVEPLVRASLAGVVERGFEPDAIEAAVNTLEFQLREMNTGGFPKGLAFMLSVMPRWIYRPSGENVADALRFEKPLAELKAAIARGDRVFEDLIDRLILSNSHFNSVELQPDSKLAGEVEAEEAARLAAVKESMSEAQIADVIRQTKELREAQLKEDPPEALASIPAVGLADLERDVKDIPTEIDAIAGGATMLSHALPSAGVVYTNVLFDLKNLPPSEVSLLPLFTRLMLEAGTSKLDATTLQRRIGARTGGISVSTSVEQPVGPGGAVSDPYDVAHHLVISGKATNEKLPELIELMQDVISDTKLDSQDKVLELLRETKSRMESSFISAGNRYAGSRLSSRNTLEGYINEITGGVSYYSTVKALLKDAADDWPSLLARLEKLRATVLARDGLVINLTADPASMDDSKKQLSDLAGRYPEIPPAGAHDKPGPWKPELGERTDEAFAITTQVNYVAAGTRLFEPGEMCPGEFAVVARALSLGYLWDNVRVAGGAYGGGCALNPSSGGFAFSSYRDPNLQATLDIYARTCDALAEADTSKEALEKAIVGTIGDMDGPLTPDQKGMRALRWYLTGTTKEMRQQYRDQVLGTSPEAFAAFAERLRKAKFAAAVFASRDAIDKANAGRSAPLPVTEIMSE